MSAPNITQQSQSPTVEAFAERAHELAEVWQSMMCVTTANQQFNVTRREIARWARNTNQAFMDTFGKSTLSEEIRVILDSLPGCVPKQLGDVGTAFLTEMTAQARALVDEGIEAVAAV